MYEELKARLRGSPSIITAQNAYLAIESLERQLAERDAEIAKYRDAPVVAYMHPYGGLLHSLSTGLERETYVIELIVKPGEQ